MWSTGRSEAALEAALPVPIDIRPLKTARRLRLRFDEPSGTLKLTCPWRTSRKLRPRLGAGPKGLDRKAACPSRTRRAVRARARDPARRTGRSYRLGPNRAAHADLTGAELRVGGPALGIGRRIELFLKRRALDVMSREVAYYAAAAGVMASSVSVGDAGTRWGSCSSQGKIRLSWRLILAPPEVRRFVVAHEVAHLVHLDHSTKFKALEARLYGPGLAEAKSALRRLGPRLRRVGLRR